jgi:hypothetical protein
LEIDIGPGKRATGGFIGELGRKDSEILISERETGGGTTGVPIDRDDGRRRFRCIIF